MSFLSRIWINPRRKQGQRFLRDPQVVHAAVLAGLPNQPVNERVLWRMDFDQPLRPALIVQTESQPSWEHIVEQASWTSADDPEDPLATVRPYADFLRDFEEGDEFAFRLTANPMKSLPPVHRGPDVTDRPPRSPRVVLATAAQQTAWLDERSSRLGFAVPDSSVSSLMEDERVPEIRITRTEKKNFTRGKSTGRGVTLRMVTFEGRLSIDDPDRFREALLSGIGPAKAYGCGLMTLARLPERG